MKISIIIPAYNVEKFLSVCLDSVLAQTYQDWEALLVDDGSTDRTPEICDEYGKRDARIRVWHTENHGLSDTRQFALAYVTGEYVLCLDSDDCIHPEYLSRAAAHAEGKKDTIVWMGYVYVPEDFTDYNDAGYHTKSCGADSARQNVQEDCFRLAAYSLTPVQAIRCIDEDGEGKAEESGNAGTADGLNAEHSLGGQAGTKEGARQSAIDRVSACVVWGKLYPVSFFENVSFPKGVRLHEDQRVNHRLFALAEQIVYDPAPLYFYRTREQSLIRKSWRRERLYIIECYMDRLDCVKAYADTEDGKRLIELVYRRLLIGLIRNYAQMREHLNGQERKNESRRLTALYRKLWEENRDVALPRKKRPVLCLFIRCPSLVAWMFRIRG